MLCSAARVFFRESADSHTPWIALNPSQIHKHNLEANQNKNKCLVSNFLEKLKSPALSPTCFAWEKVREISICCRNCSQGSLEGS